jgi:hypothetical protein
MYGSGGAHAQGVPNVARGILTVFLAMVPGLSPTGADERPLREEARSKLDFNRDIRPILAERCILCHGPDSKARASALRLDTREGATADLGGYAAIVPGQPDKSELVRRITSRDPGEAMPPPKSGKKLTAREVELLRRWIAEGAAYERHWAFVPPRRPAVPDVKDAAWCRNEIDRFILARLEREGLKPSPEADREALLRRVALDLTGLPPSLEEIDRFASDPSPDAYERFVDRLLESPAYGERWAKVWLDLARYADSQGYAEDRPRVIWPYRDWVIRAFNENMPFDRFTIEQIAGDLLPGADERVLPATAFHRNTLTNTEGGTDDEEFRNAAVVDRVNTTMQVWMGLTMACAQCHDHKYDPLSQEEYFRLFAFFNQTEDSDKPDDRPFLEIWTDEQKRRNKELAEELARLSAELERPTPELDASRARWEEELSRPVSWRPLRPAALEASAGSTLKLLDDASVRAEGAVPPAGEAYVLRVPAEPGPLAALRIEAVPDPALPKSGPGRGPDGGFLLSGVTVSLKPLRPAASSARFVRLELPGKQRFLHVAEVEVFSGGKNAALRGKARQSSTAFDGPARLAVDGNTSGDYFGARSTTHTNLEDNPWWEVDLGKTLPVERVVVWNRTDGGPEIAERIRGFRIVLLDAERRAVASHVPAAVPAPKAEWAPDGSRELALAGGASDQDGADTSAAFLTKNPEPARRGWSAPAGAAASAVLGLERPVALEAGASLEIRLEHPAGRAPLGRFRLWATGEARAAAWAALPAGVRAALARPAAERTPDQAALLAAYHRSIAPERAPLRERLAALRKEAEEMKPAGTVPVMRELPPAQRRKTRIQERGNFLVLGKEVSEGVPAALHPFPAGAPKNRLGLALWLVHPDNPLTARVLVNRTWEQIFGIGLVATSEDWGVRGEMPSHPELLDWLATEVVRQGWDLKRLVRLLVTSAAYRQSSRVTPELLARDPANRLLARGPRVRLSAETVRDQALFVAGLLSRRLGGPSVYPPQPKLGLTAAFSSSVDWEPSKGEDRYRRGLYTFWRRSVPYPSMATFDAPDRNVCTVKRVPTNTPLQALVTLNDPVYVEASQALARRIVAEGGTSPLERAAYGVRRCLARAARPAELERLVALYEEARARYAADPARARAMATDPIGPAPEGADVAELAAWTVVSNVLLNLDEMFLKR